MECYVYVTYILHFVVGGSLHFGPVLPLAGVQFLRDSPYAINYDWRRCRGEQLHVLHESFSGQHFVGQA